MRLYRSTIIILSMFSLGMVGCGSSLPSEDQLTNQNAESNQTSLPASSRDLVGSWSGTLHGQSLTFSVNSAGRVDDMSYPDFVLGYFSVATNGRLTGRLKFEDFEFNLSGSFSGDKTTISGSSRDSENKPGSFSFYYSPAL